MTQMTATKMLSYDNRRLVPGEDFVARSHRDMKVLLATRKAKVKRLAGEVSAPPEALTAKIEVMVVPPNDLNPPLTPPNDLNPPQPPAYDLAAARAEYEAKLGKRPYYGWDIEQLREKIAAAPSED